MKRSALVFGLLGVLFVTLLWWMLVIGPQNADVDRVTQELQTEEDQTLSLQTRLARLKEIKANEVSYQFAIGAMQSSIPEEPDQAAFISDINFLADSTGVRISQISLAPPAPGVAETETPVFEVAVSVTVTGQYFEVLGFLYGIEAMDRLVRTDSITLSPTEVVEEAGDAGEDGAEDTTVRQRRPVSELTIDLNLRLFTRTGVLVKIIDEVAEDGSAPADGADQEVGE
ncbi:Pilus assembly protein, PilO [bacterium BMS3Bbin02]|nr:Pilus assembly protein, PilO [bacterium BMS3Bbin02]